MANESDYQAEQGLLNLRRFVICYNASEKSVGQLQQLKCVLTCKRMGLLNVFSCMGIIMIINCNANILKCPIRFFEK